MVRLDSIASQKQQNKSLEDEPQIFLNEKKSINVTEVDELKKPW